MNAHGLPEELDDALFDAVEPVVTDATTAAKAIETRVRYDTQPLTRDEIGVVLARLNEAIEKLTGLKHVWRRSPGSRLQDEPMMGYPEMAEHFYLIPADVLEAALACLRNEDT